MTNNLLKTLMESIGRSRHLINEISEVCRREDKKERSKAPWKVKFHRENTIITNEEKWVVGSVSNEDAPLISAAPELLEALKIVLVQYGPYKDGDGAAKLHAISIAEDAIKKAESKVEDWK